MADEDWVIAATALEAPWGPIHLAASERGIVAIELMAPTEAFIEGLGRRSRGEVRWLESEIDAGTAVGVPSAVLRRLRAGRAAIESHLAGDGAALDALSLDLRDRPAWDRAVLGSVRSIPRGQTRSYGEIARQIGVPGAARAVGGAVGRNPISLAIPCHRVIAGDGSLGGYGGGWWGDRERLLELKQELLAAEGSIVLRRPPGQAAGR